MLLYCILIFFCFNLFSLKANLCSDLVISGGIFVGVWKRCSLPLAPEVFAFLNKNFLFQLRCCLCEIWAHCRIYKEIKREKETEREIKKEREREKKRERKKEREGELSVFKHYVEAVLTLHFKMTGTVCQILFLNIFWLKTSFRTKKMPNYYYKE